MQESNPNNAELDLKAIAGRARTMLLHSEVDGREFGQQVGVPYSTMRAYLDGVRPPSPEFLAGAYRAFGFLPGWLLTGEGDMKAGVRAKVETAADPVVVPMLTVENSVGNGTVNEPQASYAVAGLAFTREWLAKRQLTAKNLAVITVKGTSMDGVLASGDQLLVNKQDTQVRSGFIYVLRQRDELLVKFCQILPNGLLRVSSANQNYAPYDVDLSKSADVEIIGRVVASMREW